MRKASLPPLAALRTFEAAARLGSHQAAAEEVGRTPSAVSHQIRVLEAHLGVRLFRKLGRAVVLTPAGSIYAAATMRAVAELARAESTIRQERSGRTVRLSVAPGFALLAAMPMIHLFEAAQPDFTLVLEVDVRTVRFDQDEFDAAVRSGDGQWPGLASERLFDIHLVPMAAPSLWARLGSRPAPKDLASLPLIDFANSPRGWDNWFAKYGGGVSSPPRRYGYDNMAAAFQMAEQGAGVVLGSLPLGSGLLQAGRLQAPLPCPLDTSWGYDLVYRPGDNASAKICALRVWLRDVVAALAKTDEDESLRHDRPRR